MQMTKTLNMLKVIYNESNPRVTFSEMLILECIKNKSLTKTEIRKILLIDGASISRSVDRLVKKGMVEKTGDTFKYSLTQNGENQVVEIGEVSKTLLSENFDELSEEIEITLKNLKVLTGKLEKLYE